MREWDRSEPTLGIYIEATFIVGTIVITFLLTAAATFMKYVYPILTTH